MPKNHRAWRWRDEFPRTFAAWAHGRRASTRSARWARDSVTTPSAWTTAVLAGGLALLLTVLLLIADAPPDADVTSPAGDPETVETAFQMNPEANADPESPTELELSVGRLDFRMEWDQRTPMLWTSTPIGEAFPPAAFLPADDWRAAGPRTALADAPTAGFEPYYLRAALAESEETALLPAAADPSSPPGPGAARDLRVDVVALPAQPAESGEAVVQTVLVRNRSDEPIEQVAVRQLVPAIERVIDVDPPAAITPEGALLWELAELGPQAERRLTVTMLPPGDESAETVTYVDVQSQFGVVTAVREAFTPEPFTPAPAQPELVTPQPVTPEPVTPEHSLPLLAQPDRTPAERPAPEIVLPERVLPESFPDAPLVNVGAEKETVLPAAVLPEESPSLVLPGEEPGWAPVPRPLPLDPARSPRPLLKLTAESPASVRPGEIVTTVFQVANTGDAAAVDVVLTVYVAPQLQHKHGRTVEHRIPRIEPGERHTARLYTKAQSAGTARLQAVLLQAGGEDAEYWETIRIVDGGE